MGCSAMLIDSPRFKPGDRQAWESASAGDLACFETSRHRNALDRAELRIVEFSLAGKDGWVSTSWGKDSVCIADMAASLTDWPIVWIRANPVANPDCEAVRDAFLKLHPKANYDEIIIDLEPDSDGKIDPEFRLDHGFELGIKRYGNRRIIGLRGAESPKRKKILNARKFKSENRCYPILDWTDEDVFAYLAGNGLPIHPVYAMSNAGVIRRANLRVSTLGGREGRGMGRAEWEDAYYPEFMKYRN